MHKILSSLLILLVMVTGANAKMVDTTIDSKILKQQRALTISLPKDYDANKQGRYPVMYLLDGPHNVGHTAGSLDYLAKIGMAPEMIIVGIVNVNRFQDLTPTKAEGKEESGGGERLLDFIDQELMPYIEKNYRTVDYKIFTGHSLGGLMVIHALATRPELFDAHFAYSPSLWYDKEKTLQLATKAFAEKPQLSNYLYVNLANEKGPMVTAFDKFEQLLKDSGPKALRYKLERFDLETHGSIPLIGQMKAYRDLYANWQLPREVLDQDVAAVKAFFAKQSKDFGYKILPSENSVNNMGYYQLQNKQAVDLAVELFELNAKNYPHSSNVWDSLADGYKAQGKLDKALEAMEQALRIGGKQDPNYQFYVTHHQTIVDLLKQKNKL